MNYKKLKNLIKEEIKRLNEHKKCNEHADCDVAPYYICHEGTCVEEDFSNPYPNRPINDKLGNKGTYGKPEWKCKCVRQVAGSGHPELGILPTIEVGCASWCCESGATIC